MHGRIWHRRSKVGMLFSLKLTKWHVTPPTTDRLHPPHCKPKPPSNHPLPFLPKSNVRMMQGVITAQSCKNNPLSSPPFPPQLQRHPSSTFHSSTFALAAASLLVAPSVTATRCSSSCVTLRDYPDVFTSPMFNARHSCSISITCNPSSSSSVHYHLPPRGLKIWLLMATAAAYLRC